MQILHFGFLVGCYDIQRSAGWTDCRDTGGILCDLRDTGSTTSSNMFSGARTLSSNTHGKLTVLPLSSLITNTCVPFEDA